MRNSLDKLEEAEDRFPIKNANGIIVKTEDLNIFLEILEFHVTKNVDLNCSDEYMPVTFDGDI